MFPIQLSVWNQRPVLFKQSLLFLAPLSADKMAAARRGALVHTRAMSDIQAILLLLMAEQPLMARAHKTLWYIILFLSPPPFAVPQCLLPEAVNFVTFIFSSKIPFRRAHTRLD